MHAAKEIYDRVIERAKQAQSGLCSKWMDGSNLFPKPLHRLWYGWICIHTPPIDHAQMHIDCAWHCGVVEALKLEKGQNGIMEMQRHKKLQRKICYRKIYEHKWYIFIFGCTQQGEWVRRIVDYCANIKNKGVGHTGGAWFLSLEGVGWLNPKLFLDFVCVCCWFQLRFSFRKRLTSKKWLSTMLYYAILGI